MPKKRICFFLATEKGYEVLQGLLNSGKQEYIGGVVSFHEIEVQRDYFDDIKKICIEEDINFSEWRNVRNNLNLLMQEWKISSCIAISWRYLIPLKINNDLEDKLIVFHDSLLPKYRGFAPLVNAMINGERLVGASVLFADEHADCGDLIMQEMFEIDAEVKIQDVINQMAKTYTKLACKLVDDIVEGNLKTTVQNEAEATYSIWRDEDDYWIDWSWPAENILRFVNAVGYPYKGAKTIHDGKVIRIVECNLENDIHFTIRMPGKIWLLNNNAPTIVCGSGLIKINKALDEDNHIYQFKKLRSRLGNEHRGLIDELSKN